MISRGKREESRRERRDLPVPVGPRIMRRGLGGGVEGMVEVLRWWRWVWEELERVVR